MQFAVSQRIYNKSCVNMLHVANEILMNFRSRRKSSGDVYINDPIDTDRDGNSLTLLDLMAEEQDIVAILDLKDKSTQLYRYILRCLDSREQEIVRLRYGLNNQPPMTQREVAKKLAISRSYVSRLEKKSLETLRKEFECHST